MKKKFKAFIILLLFPYTMACAPLAQHDLAAQQSHPPASSSDHTNTSDTNGSQGLSKENLYDLLVAELAGRQTNYALATEKYLAVAKRSQSADVAKRATKVALYAKDEESSLAAANLWVKLAPNTLEGNMILFALQVKFNKQESALITLQSLDNIIEKKSPNRFLQVMDEIIKASSDHTTILELLNSLREKHPDNINLQFTVGVLAFNLRQYELAHDAINATIQLDDSLESAIHLKVKILNILVDTSTAIHFLEERLNQFSDKNAAMSLYARLLLEAKQLDKAEEKYLWLKANNPDSPDILFALALLNIEQRDYENADNHLDTLYQLYPENNDIKFYQGYVDEKLGKLEQAVAHYHMVSHGPNYFIAQLQASILLAELKAFDQAHLQLESIEADNDAESVQLFIAKANLLSETEDFNSAYLVLSEAIKQYPQDLNLYYARALVADQLQKVELVEQDLMHVIEKNPAHARALNALGYVLADKTQRLDEALSFIERALTLEPENPAMIDSMGWLQYRLGNLESAILYLDKAYTLSKQDPEIAAHLTEVLIKNGETQRAKNIWLNAIKKNPDDKQLQEFVEQFSPNLQ